MIYMLAIRLKTNSGLSASVGVLGVVDLGAVQGIYLLHMLIVFSFS
jgi:hypothetical protein